MTDQTTTPEQSPAPVQTTMGGCQQDACSAVADFMLRHGLATGHGDSVDDLLKELSWQFLELLTQRNKYREMARKYGRRLAAICEAFEIDGTREWVRLEQVENPEIFGQNDEMRDRPDSATQQTHSTTKPE